MNTDTTTMIPFLFGENLIRTEMRSDGPWFVIADLCKVFEMGNPTRVCERIYQDDLTSSKVIDNMGREQTMNLCNESGLYAVIFQSRKPIAREFTRWVTSEVLPQIRRTGSYNTGHQAYLGLIADQIRMGVSPDMAAKGAMKLCQPQAPLHAIPIRSSTGYHPTITDVEVQELLDVMQPDSAYTALQLADAMPPRHKLRKGTDPSKRATVGKIMQRAISTGRAIRIPGREISYQLPPIAAFASAEPT